MTRIYAPEKCQCPSIREAVLEEAVLTAIQTQVRELVDAGAVMEAAREAAHGGRSKNEHIRAIHRAEQEKRRLSEAQFRLYDSMEQGMIGRDEYVRFKERYRGEIAEQDSQIRRLRDLLAQMEAAREQDDAFVASFREFGTIRAIDRDVLGWLLDHIEVTDTRRLDIYFKFSSQRERRGGSEAENTRVC